MTFDIYGAYMFIYETYMTYMEHIWKCFTIIYDSYMSYMNIYGHICPYMQICMWHIWHTWQNIGHFGHTWVNNGSLHGSYLGRMSHIWINHGIYVGHMGHIWIICGSNMGQPWYVLVIYSIYGSTIGHIRVILLWSYVE